MLSGRVDQHGAVLARHGERDLAFQIKVFLPANVERTGTAKRGCRDCFGGIAVDEGVIGKNALAGRFALLDGDVGALRFDIEKRPQGRAPAPPIACASPAIWSSRRWPRLPVRKATRRASRDAG
jgi:hypothetical protein